MVLWCGDAIKAIRETPATTTWGLDFAALPCRESRLVFLHLLILTALDGGVCLKMNYSTTKALSDTVLCRRVAYLFQEGGLCCFHGKEVFRSCCLLSAFGQEYDWFVPYHHLVFSPTTCVSPPSGCQLAVCACSETHLGRLRLYPMTILRKEHPIMIHGNLPGVLNRILCCMQLSIHSIPEVWASFGDIKVLCIQCLWHKNIVVQDVCPIFP